MGRQSPPAVGGPGDRALKKSLRRERSPAPDDDLAAAYELLRAGALGEGSVPDRPRSGLAVLAREGVAAWLGFCRRREPSAAPAPPAPDRESADGLELVHILAGLFLAQIFKENPAWIQPAPA